MDRSSFRKRVFPKASAREWNDWRWQLRNSFRRIAELDRFLSLSDDERQACGAENGRLPFAITPYYASLLSPEDPAQPLRRTMIPSLAETQTADGEMEDSLGENEHMVVPGLVHTYPDKVLFLATDVCAVYCRYCTRSRLVGKGGCPPTPARWEAAIDYIRKTTAIRDVLISGGEPLTLADSRIEWLVRRLRAIPHVDLIRFSTKAPAVLPQRITKDFVRMMRKYHPLWMSIHFTHPDELTAETEKACIRLADSGIPMCSQTVLLRGVNDEPETIRLLMQGLLRCRVKPYYLHQCDAVAGASHFRASVSRGQAIIRSLHGHTTGYAVPMYMIDAPGGGGKVPVGPDYIAGRDGDELLLRNYEGRIYRCRDAKPS